jgi:hypothetical protein
MTDAPAVDEVKELPSYSEDPFMWERLLRNQMTERLSIREEIKDFNVKQYVVNSAFRLAKQRGIMGSQVALWDLYEERLAWVRNDKQSVLEYRERIAAYAQAAGFSAEEINHEMHIAAPRGISNVCFYYNDIDKKADLKANPPAAIPAPQKKSKGATPDRPDIAESLAAAVEPDWQYDTNTYPFEFAPRESELDALLGRQRHTRPQPREWSALRLTGGIAARSAFTHFSTDLAIIDPKAEAKAVIQWWLGSEVSLHAEKFGMEITVQKLQNLLDHYGEDGFTMGDKKLTLDDWVAWLKQHNWVSADVIAILNEASLAADKGEITKLSQWPTLDTAENVVKRYYAKREADLAGADDPGDEEQPADEQPAEAEESAPPAAAEPTEPSNIIILPQANIPCTLTGIPILSLGKALRAYLPANAYTAITNGRQGAGKVSIDGKFIRQRFDAIFGVGLWRISPQELAGRVEYQTEWDDSFERDWDKDKRAYYFVLDKDGEKIPKRTLYHVCTLQAHTFEYAVIMPTGEFTWIKGFTTSAVHRNIGHDNAYAGAMTTLTKHFFKLMGGMDNVDGRLYADAKKDIDKAEQERLKRKTA